MFFERKREINIEKIKVLYMFTHTQYKLEEIKTIYLNEYNVFFFGLGAADGVVNYILLCIDKKIYKNKFKNKYFNLTIRYKPLKEVSIVLSERCHPQTLAALIRLKI